jgi:Fur family ferric uptake transcriptional regulator
MTNPSRRPPVIAGTPEEAAAAFRKAGGRLTAARRLVLEALFAADRPVSAEDIAGGLGGRMTRSDLTSVYRTLERLEQMGLVRHVHIGHGPGLYELERPGEAEYLICERCGRVDRVEAAALDRARAEIRRAFGYEARFSHFPISGLCAGCAKNEPAQRRGRRPVEEDEPAQRRGRRRVSERTRP